LLADRIGGSTVSWVAWQNRAWEIAWGSIHQRSFTALVSEALIYDGIAAVHSQRGRHVTCTLPSSLVKGGYTHQHGVDRFDV